MGIGKYFLFYKQREILDIMVEHAKDKEIVGSIDGKYFTKRPDVIQNENDILAMVKKGVTSFHCSEELWKDPLLIESSMTKPKLDDLRKGWDLIIDIDCPYFPYSQKATDLIVKEIQNYGIENVSTKFSGNKGFHIGVPFESFPKIVNLSDTGKQFPSLPRKISLLISKNIADKMRDYVLSEGLSFKEIASRIKKEEHEIFYEEIINGKKVKKLKINDFIEIDTILLSSRHMYRMPYSFNEKSGLISVPIDNSEILSFRREDALPSKVLSIEKKKTFLDRSKSGENEALGLIIDALDVKEEVEKSQIKRVSTMIKQEKKDKYYSEKELSELAEKQKTSMKFPEDYFPPCMKFRPIKDGKKRYMYLLSSFLQKANWEKEDIIEYLKEKNQEFDDPVRENYLLSQIKYYFDRKYLTPLCTNEIYKDLGICEPDKICKFIKNPWQYPFKKHELLEKKKKIEEMRNKNKRKKYKKGFKNKKNNKQNDDSSNNKSTEEKENLNEKR